jgi:WW domain
MSTQDLGNGWVAAVDPSSGRTYYANTITQQTSWEYPADL